MTETALSTPLTSAATEPIMFPTLTVAQIARVASHGVIRPITRGEVLIESGQKNVPFFVVKAGEIEVIRPSDPVDLLVAVLHEHRFSGDISMILGRPALMRLRVSESGEVVQLTGEEMHALIQTDAEISEVLMKALIYRRIELVAQGIGDALLIGSAHSAATLRIRAFLTRNNHPFKYLDLDHDADVRNLLDRFHVDPAEIPVLICRSEAVLKNPSNQTIAEHLGFNERIDHVQLRDVVIVGAGPAGLAAAVYAASEGLDALVIEASSPGGQAGSSSRIENYLGFPTGISGQELAERAYAQAQKFGASVMIAKGAAELICEQNQHGVRLDDGATVPARSVIIATGARYRKPALARLAHFEGAGVYYSATFLEEAQLGDDDEVVVVGGANSAGQAALFLARTNRRVHMLVRADSLLIARRRVSNFCKCCGKQVILRGVALDNSKKRCSAKDVSTVANQECGAPSPWRCWRAKEHFMTDPASGIDFANLPVPNEGIRVTLFITVRKVARSRDFYSRVLGGTVVMDENPCIVKLSNSWIIMNPGGPPTPDKPDISVVDYQPGNTTSMFMNLRVADIQACYVEWKAKGAQFVTPPIDRGAEIRCYMRDPDGYLIEVGQSIGLLRGQRAAKRPEDLPG